MKRHHFIQLAVIATLLFFAPLALAEETEEDYDAGIVEKVEEIEEKLPQPQAQVQPDITLDAKKFSIAEPAFYIPVGIGAGVLLNILAVVAVLVMRRRRAMQVTYSKMRLNASNPVHSTTVELLDQN